MSKRKQAKADWENMGTAPSHVPPDFDFDDEETQFEDDGDYLDAECGLRPDGQCALAGTEHCDFCCPNRNSELFAGSAAWHEKHKTK